ncbi:hypothetical protein KUTeg_022091 [Tegillarca granosa]|uniref:Copper transport protein n=1 Tax=Tegillarca granosa TaxID=220873 RepID=A0ABQ9E9L4_TEGGR|nr:hypothetical protein KUTeg_022091 [Tegillarca granosa]
MSMHMNHSGMMTDMNMTMHESTRMNMHHGHTTTTTMPMHNGHGMNNMGGMDHNMNMNMNGSDSCGMGMMMMYFHTGYCEYILFEAIRTTKVAEMIGACIVIFVLAALYEGLKVLREELLRKSLLQSKYTTKSLTIPANSKENIICQHDKLFTFHTDSTTHISSHYKLRPNVGFYDIQRLAVYSDHTWSRSWLLPVWMETSCHHRYKRTLSLTIVTRT